MTVTFLSLGTVLIDHFKYVSEGSTRDEKHPGGGGLFACAGARVWLRPEEIRVPVSGKKNEEMISQLLQLSSGSEKMWIWDDEGDMLEALTEYRGSERRCVCPLKATMACVRYNSERYFAAFAI